MKKVLKSTLLDFIDATRRENKASVLWLQNTESRRQRKELKKRRDGLWDIVYKLSYDLKAQSGLSDDLWRSLVADGFSVREFGQICEVLKALGVEVTGEKWFVEGEMTYDEKLERYFISDGTTKIVLNCDDEIMVQLQGYWLKDYICYNELRGRFSLCGYEPKTIKLDGMLARANIYEVAE